MLSGEKRSFEEKKESVAFLLKNTDSELYKKLRHSPLIFSRIFRENREEQFILPGIGFSVKSLVLISGQFSFVFFFLR
jgi:hypothetical protein